MEGLFYLFFLTMKGRKCVIKILLIVMVFCFGFVGFFLCYQMAQKSDEDQPFRLNPQLSLDPTLAITDHSECSDVDSCGQLGDHLAEMLF